METTASFQPYYSMNKFFEVNGRLYITSNSSNHAGYITEDGETFSSGVYFTEIIHGTVIWVRNGKTGQNPYYSIDGKKWTQSTGPSIYNGFYNGFLYAGDIFIMLGHRDGYYYLYYSTDGMTWTLSNITISTYVASIPVYGNGRFAINLANCIYYSTDGKTWTESGRGGVEGIYYNNGIFITVDDSDEGLYYSTDCISWTRCPGTSGYDFLYTYVLYANGLWYANTNTHKLWYSTDGMTWTQSDIPISSDYINKVIYNGNIYICNNDNGVYISTDGKSWTNINSLTGTLKYVNGMFTLSNNAKKDYVYYSFDGINWKRSIGIYKAHDLCYYKDKYFLGGEVVLYTEDFAF